MDGCSVKRNRSGTVVPRRACGLVMRDNNDTKDQNSQFCNRIGCNGRLKYRSVPLNSAEKAKYSRPSINSSNGNEIARSSLKISCPIPRAKISAQDSPRKFLSPLESLSKHCAHHELNIAKSNTSTGSGRNCQTQIQPKMKASNTPLVMPAEEGSLSTGLKDSSKKVARGKPQSGCHNVPSTSLSTTRNSTSGTSRNLKSNSLSDVIPRVGLSSESRNGRELLKRRMAVGGSSSSSRVKTESVTSSKDEIFPSTSCASISSARHNRNRASTHGNISLSAQTRRSVNVNSRITNLNREGETSFSVTESRSNIPRSPRSETRNNAYHASSPRPSLAASFVASSCHTNPEQIGDGDPRIATLTSTEQAFAQGLRRHHLFGAAEVLLALERMEQDEELTYEQLLLLENNLFLGNFYDEHRDMRLDIDNMSYEELLALGDRMGTVSTALSDEAFAKYVKRAIYQTPSLELRVGGCREDEADIKCSICQEEYAVGDEIGRLGCEHGYHVECLQQWLRMKNWCPICKASAEAP